MHTLRFTLNPQAVVRIYDAVLCLARFSEIISLEATDEKLTLSTLNSSKTAYASFSFERTTFFEKYEFNPSHIDARSSRDNGDKHFACQLYNRALLSVFKGRLGDARDKDTAIERCECLVQDQTSEVESRLVVKFVCRHGVIKTYKLSFEAAEVVHAVFNRSTAKNTWTINALALKSFAEYFGAKTEELDIFTENGRTTFTSYTERLMNGKDVLKQPLQTAITVDNLEFEDFRVESGMHICLMVKDFKSIVSHAETIKSDITIAYSFPTKPMLFTYEEHGMHCNFTLMTTGTYRGNTATPAPAEKQPKQTGQSKTLDSRRISEARSPLADARHAMLPPNQPASRSFTREPPSQRVQRPSPPPPKPSLDPESLFLPADEDEDRQWGEKNYDEEEDVVGWSANAMRTNSVRASHESRASSIRLEPYTSWSEQTKTQLPPTQKLSEVDDLFGD